MPEWTCPGCGGDSGSGCWCPEPLEEIAEQHGLDYEESDPGNPETRG